MEGDPFNVITLSSVKDRHQFQTNAIAYLRRYRALENINGSVSRRMTHACADLAPEDVEALRGKGFTLTPELDYDDVHRTRWRISWE